MSSRIDPRNWHLYVITDEKLSGGKSHVEIARQAIEGGADVIQLRDKSSPGKYIYDAAREIRILTSQAGIPFIVNDRLDIAMAVDADGVHLGQDDIPASAARRIIPPGKIIGVSAASEDEIDRALKDGADYIGIGAVYEARGTKPDADAPLGPEWLAGMRKLCKIPMIAIGGIKHDNVAEVIKSGADGAAVISAIVGASDITAATREMKEKIIEAKTSRKQRSEK